MFHRSLSLLVAAAALAARVTSAQQTAFQVDCPAPTGSSSSSSFETYVNTLLDSLHAAGLTTFEQLVAQFTETTDGFDVLDGIWASASTSNPWTVLAPTNDALWAAGIQPSAYLGNDSTTTEALYELVTYHVLPEQITSATLASGSVSVETIYTPAQADKLAATTSSASSGVEVALNSSVLVGGATSIANVPSGLAIYKINTVLKPSSDAIAAAASSTSSSGNSTTTAATKSGSLSSVLASLASSTTSSPSSGLRLFATALNRTGQLATLDATVARSNGKLTVFAPADVAFSGSMSSQSMSTWATVLKGHYSTAQSLPSSQFASASTKLFMANANAVTFTTNSSGTYVVAGTSSARVLRSDIGLANGAELHVIDSLLNAQALYTSASTNGTTGSGSSLIGAAAPHAVVAGWSTIALVALTGAVASFF